MPKPPRRGSHTRILHVVKRTTSVRSVMKVDSQYQFLSELKMMFHYGTTVGHKLSLLRLFSLFPFICTFFRSLLH